MPSLIDIRKAVAMELILAILRERVSRCADGLQISSRTMQRTLREEFGKTGSYAPYSHVKKTLVKAGILVQVERSQKRTIFRINASRIPAEVTA